MIAAGATAPAFRRQPKRNAHVAVIDAKVVFISYAAEDEGVEAALRRRVVDTEHPYVFVDLSLKCPEDHAWLATARHRIERCDGVIALVSAASGHSPGQEWELQCAREAGKPVLGVWARPDDATALDGVPTVRGHDDELAAFIDGIPRSRPEWGGGAGRALRALP